LCTSLNAYAGIRTHCYCFIVTKDWRRRNGSRRSSGLGAERSKSLNNHNVGAMERGETSNSSDGEGGRNWRDIQDDDDDFGESNEAVDSNLSSVKWKITDSEDSNDIAGQSSSPTNQEPDHPIASSSLDSSNGPGGIVDDDDDVVLNRDETGKNYNSGHQFPRQPDFLDLCCAGDPLQVEKHLQFPEVKLRKSKGKKESEYINQHKIMG
jgi:hypothetical protein